MRFPDNFTGECNVFELCPSLETGLVLHYTSPENKEHISISILGLGTKQLSYGREVVWVNYVLGLWSSDTNVGCGQEMGNQQLSLI